MKRRVYEVVLWAVTTLIVVVTLWPSSVAEVDSSTRILPSGRATHTSVAPAGRDVMMFDADTLERMSARTADHDPFRLERRPPTIPFSTSQVGIAVPAPSAPAVRLVLQGIIGGPPWQAILSGVPGHDGTVLVQSGDTLGGIAVRKITRDSTIIRMKDSTVVVTLAKRGM